MTDWLPAVLAIAWTALTTVVAWGFATGKFVQGSSATATKVDRLEERQARQDLTLARHDERLKAIEHEMHFWPPK